MDDRTSIEQLDRNRKPLLAELHRRQAVVRDYVRGVARQYATGLYLFGRPGTAKTYTVKDVLDRDIAEPYCYQRGHLTPVGLFELIADHPEEVIVLDDLVTIFRSDVALQILLSALEHPAPDSPDRGRIVRYRMKGDERRICFRGGIVCISNRELHDDELLGAFKSRVHTLNYDPSDAQLGALMLDAASRGLRGIRPEDASEVARLPDRRDAAAGLPLRPAAVLDKALPDFQQWKDGEAESDWRNLISASIEQHLVAWHAEETPPSRQDRKHEEHSVIRHILRIHARREDRVQAWTKQTGKSSRFLSAAGRNAVTVSERVKLSKCQPARRERGRRGQLCRGISARGSRWSPDTHSDRLAEVRRQIRALKAAEHPVVRLVHPEGPHEHKVAYRAWEDVPEGGKLSMLQDLVDWSGISNKSMATILLGSWT